MLQIATELRNYQQNVSLLTIPSMAVASCFEAHLEWPFDSTCCDRNCAEAQAIPSKTALTYDSFVIPSLSLGVVLSSRYTTLSSAKSRTT
eukprot:150484-Pelagomonas_calceolata.AAC.2